MTNDQMNAVTADCLTKSAKIRTLAGLGVSRADIANYLDIRYQHVRNVLVAPAPSGSRATAAKSPADKSALNANLPLAVEQAKLTLAARLGIPTSVIEINIKF